MTKQRMIELCNNASDAMQREIEEFIRSEDLHGAAEYTERMRGMIAFCQTLAAMWEEGENA